MACDTPEMAEMIHFAHKNDLKQYHMASPSQSLAATSLAAPPFLPSSSKLIWSGSCPYHAGIKLNSTAAKRQEYGS